MTTLSVHTACQYLTAGEQWRRNDHRARIAIKCVKNEPFNGYWDIFIDGKRTRIDENNRNAGLDLAAGVVARKLSGLVGGPVTLVPVPNSDATVDNCYEFRTLTLARKVASKANGPVEAAPLFLWRSEKPKQHQISGPRHASQFIPNLALVNRPNNRVVIIDDVITSGSQMLACAYLLRKAGYEVLFGMAVGRTTTVQTEDTLQWVEDQISQNIV